MQLKGNSALDAFLTEVPFVLPIFIRGLANYLMLWCCVQISTAVVEKPGKEEKDLFMV